MRLYLGRPKFIYSKCKTKQTKPKFSAMHMSNTNQAIEIVIKRLHKPKEIMTCWR